ncbi:MAG: hypothetical protein WC058_13010 [Phycisphaeraceae bacterium]
MYVVIQYIIGCCVTVLLGLISAAFVFLNYHFVLRRKLRLETVFQIAGLIGIALIGVGIVGNERWLAGAGLLFVGWVGVLVLAIPIVFVWQLIRRR